MLDSIAVCGDSFGVGHGTAKARDGQTMIQNSFGNIVSQHYNLPLRMYARSGCCNYVIDLQIKKIIQQFDQKKINPLVLITTTHHSRFTFEIESEPGYVTYDLSDVDYLTHNHFENKEQLLKHLPFDLKDRPKLTSDTVTNFLEYKKTLAHNLGKLFELVEHKLPAVTNYFKHLYSDSIKHEYDQALIVMMHQKLKIKNIPHLILCSDQYLANFIESKNFLHNDWGMYSRLYPDIYNSGHCTAQGHQIVADCIIKKFSCDGTLNR